MRGVGEKVEAFIRENLLPGDGQNVPSPGDSLVGVGVIDSTGVLELIEFLEAEFAIRIEDSEAVTENLDSIERITAFVQRKLEVGEAQH